MSSILSLFSSCLFSKSLVVVSPFGCVYSLSLSLYPLELSLLSYSRLFILSSCVFYLSFSPSCFFSLFLIKLHSLSLSLPSSVVSSISLLVSISLSTLYLSCRSFCLSFAFLCITLSFTLSFWCIPFKSRYFSLSLSLSLLFPCVRHFAHSIFTGVLQSRKWKGQGCG